MTPLFHAGSGKQLAATGGDSLAPSAVIFDMDGLLFDTEKLYLAALADVAEKAGCKRIDHAVARSTVGLSWSATRGLISGLLPNGVGLEEFVDQWIATYELLASERLEMKAGALELLDHLRRLGIPCALATGSMKPTVLSHLNKQGLFEFFDVIVTAEDCPVGKPSPEPFLEAARRLRIDPAECLALEDSINGVMSACRAGMVTVMVPDLIDPDPATANLCALVASSLSEVRALIIASPHGPVPLNSLS